MQGEGGKLRGLSQLVQLYTGAQINFGDLGPYLTYAAYEVGTIYNDVTGKRYGENCEIKKCLLAFSSEIFHVMLYACQKVTSQKFFRI
jgi:hypothetical protein